MTAPYFVAPDADDELTLWRHDPDRPDYPQPVLRRFEVGDPVVWDGLAAWAAGGMSAPTPDLPAVTLTDEERDALWDGTWDLNRVAATVERVVAARLAAQPVAPAPDRDALRLAAHLLDDNMRTRCDLTAEPGEADEDERPRRNRGRCPGVSVGVRWEDGFADVVCEQHAQNAEARGALVVRPKRHDGTTDAPAARPAPSGDADLAARVQGG